MKNGKSENRWEQFQSKINCSSLSQREYPKSKKQHTRKCEHPILHRCKQLKWILYIENCAYYKTIAASDTVIIDKLIWQYHIYDSWFNIDYRVLTVGYVTA